MTTRARLVRLYLLVLPLSVMAGCRNSERLAAVGVAAGAMRGYNVLLITIDTLRANRLGCYGYCLAHTPAVDGLAREGVRCTYAATSGERASVPDCMGTP